MNYSEEGIAIPLTIKLNPVTMEKYITLTKYMLEGFDAEVDIVIEGNDYEREEQKQAIMETYNALQTLPDSPAKLPIMALLFERMLDLNRDPNKADIMKTIKEEIEKSQQPNPMEQAQAQAQQQTADAKMLESQAKAENLKANADKTNLETQEKAQQIEQTQQAQEMMMGMAEQEAPL